MRIVKWLLAVVLLVAVVGVLGFFFVVPGIADKRMNPVAEHAPFTVSPEARALHDNMIIGDWHADSMLWQRSFLKHNVRGQVDLPRLIEGNVAVQVLTAVTKSPSGQNYDSNSAETFDNITLLAVGQRWPVASWGSLYERAAYQADRLSEYAARSDGTLKVILTQADLDAVLAARAKGETVVGALMGMEGAHPLEGDLTNLDRLMAKGYRLVGLQHFFDNELGGSLHGEGNHGLTPFGREVVKAIVDKGLILDVAHSSPQVVADVLEMTDIPIVLSHTGLRSVCDVKRNIPDELMKGIAESGGVIGIGYWADVTCDDSPQGIARTITAAIRVLGEDHVSLGSDYDGTIATQFDTAELAALTQALMDEGLSEDVIRKVSGGNLVRVMRARLN